MKDKMVQIFEDMGGDQYDQNNSSFKSVSDNIQVLNSIILKDLPENAKILSVGIGTGADIIELGKKNPKWTFVGVEPARSMLNKCREKLEHNGLLKRCFLHHGYLDTLNSDEKYDAVICLFVMHFLKGMDKKEQMISMFSSYLKVGGILIQTEISVDVNLPEYEHLIENWKGTHALAGAKKETLKKIPETIEKTLGVISPEKTSQLLKNNGFPVPVQFFQSFLIRGWYAEKK